MRSVVLILNHFRDRHLYRLYEDIHASCGAVRDVVLLSDRTRTGVAWARAPSNLEEYAFSLKDLIALGYPGKQDLAQGTRERRTLKLGNAELPVLRFFAEHQDYDHYWIVEYDVRYSGVWDELFSAFDANDADLLGTTLTRYPDYPEWTHWSSLAIPDADLADADKIRGFFPVYRLSRAALSCLHERYLRGCSGHMETLLPTLLWKSGHRLEDIGGSGEFVAPGNVNRHYTNMPATELLSPGTFVYRPARTRIGTESGLLWHPVKQPAPLLVRFVDRLIREREAILRALQPPGDGVRSPDGHEHT